ADVAGLEPTAVQDAGATYATWRDRRAAGDDELEDGPLHSVPGGAREPERAPERDAILTALNRRDRVHTGVLAAELDIPLPTAARRPGTSARMIRKKPTRANACPTPAIASGAAIESVLTCGHDPCTTSISQTSPTACSARPKTTTRRPCRASSRGASSVPRKNATAIGLIATPDCNALSCSPLWTVSANTNMNAPNPMK